MSVCHMFNKVLTYLLTFNTRSKSVTLRLCLSLWTYSVQIYVDAEQQTMLEMKTRCSAIAERLRCRVRNSFRQK